MAIFRNRDLDRALLAAVAKSNLSADDQRKFRRVMLLRPIQARAIREAAQADLQAAGHLNLTGDTVGIDWNSVIQHIIDSLLAIFMEWIKDWLSGDADD